MLTISLINILSDLYVLKGGFIYLQYQTNFVCYQMRRKIS